MVNSVLIEMDVCGDMDIVGFVEIGANQLGASLVVGFSYRYAQLSSSNRRIIRPTPGRQAGVALGTHHDMVE